MTLKRLIALAFDILGLILGGLIVYVTAYNISKRPLIIVTFIAGCLLTLTSLIRMFRWQKVTNRIGFQVVSIASIVVSVIFLGLFMLVVLALSGAQH